MSVREDKIEIAVAGSWRVESQRLGAESASCKRERGREILFRPESSRAHWLSLWTTPGESPCHTGVTPARDLATLAAATNA